jgi:hypothetical protein
MVETVEVGVREKLAGQVTDGDSLGSLDGREQVVARKIKNHLAVFPGIDDFANKPKGIRTLDFSRDNFQQDFMVDALEIFPDIALQNVRVFSRKLRVSVYGFMGPLIFPAGIGVEDKGPVKYRLDDIAQGMVNDPIPVGRRADQPHLRVIYKKIPVSAVPVGFSDQFPLQPEQFFFQVQLEPGGLFLEPFAPAGLPGCTQKILERGYLIIKVSVSFHFFVYFSQPPTDIPTSSMDLAEKA